MDMQYFFSSVDKWKHFAIAMEMHLALNTLRDFQLSLTGVPNDLDKNKDENGQNTLSRQDIDQDELLGTGIEIFKLRNEQVADFTFDHANKDMMAIGIQAKGMREISVSDTLIYRNRTKNGLEMLDEEMLSWTDCLHRYERIK